MKLINTLSNLKLQNILNCSKIETDEILKFRNEKEIRKNMFTQHIISKKEHLEWLKKLKINNSVKNLIVFKNNEVIGFFGISKIFKQESAYWAFYISKEFRKIGIGISLEYLAIEYLFKRLRLKKIFCEVLLSNPDVINLHKKFGFTLTNKNNYTILINKKKIKLVKLKLKKEKWEILKLNIKKKFFNE